MMLELEITFSEIYDVSRPCSTHENDLDLFPLLQRWSGEFLNLRSSILAIFYSIVRSHVRVNLAFFLRWKFKSFFRTKKRLSADENVLTKASFVKPFYVTNLQQRLHDLVRDARFCSYERLLRARWENEENISHLCKEEESLKSCENLVDLLRDLPVLWEIWIKGVGLIGLMERGTYFCSRILRCAAMTRKYFTCKGAKERGGERKRSWK